MFTGIIQDCGTIESIKGNLFTISHDLQEPFTVGESVALSGMCATVVQIESQKFTVEIMEESRNRTIFGLAKIGELINLERSAIMGARNSGHFVLGHVDEVGTVIKREKQGDYELFRISITPENASYIVFKGSISVDGISLTISQLSSPQTKEPWLEVSIISHTLAITNLKNKAPEHKVNLEFDILGKYILRHQALNQ